jgi:hypothetical protein
MSALTQARNNLVSKPPLFASSSIPEQRMDYLEAMVKSKMRDICELLVAMCCANLFNS